MSEYLPSQKTLALVAAGLITGCTDGLENIYWGSLEVDKQTIQTENVGGISVVFLGLESDRAKINPVLDSMTTMLTTMEINKNPELKTLRVIFSNSSEGIMQESTDGFTRPGTKDGVKTMVLNEGADKAVIEHELIHAIWQSAESSDLPSFLSEGVAYEYKDPDPSWILPAVDPDYLFKNISGLYAADGELFEGNGFSDTAFIQYDVMRAFWKRLDEIDPGIKGSILQTKSKPENFMLKDIPAFILDNTQGNLRATVTAFLADSTIFTPPTSTNFFIVPDIGEENHPAVSIYYVDEDQFAIETPLPFWYQSKKDGVIISPFKIEPTLTKSNERNNFKKTSAEEGVKFDFRIKTPDDDQTKDFSFKYNSSTKMWMKI